MARPAYNPEKRTAIEADICAKALNLFEHSGYRSVSMRAIADELGWSATALYRYFANKEALLAAIRADGFIQMRDMLRSVRHRAQSPRDTAALAIKEYVNFALTSSAIYQLMYELDQGEIAKDPKVYANRKLAFNQAIGIAEDLLSEMEREGDATELAHLFWLNAHGLTALAVAHQLDLGKRLEDLIDPTINVLLQGLETQTGS